jgi:hypothetical protein
MDVKSGAMVGFVTAIGGVAGLVFGWTAASLVDAKRPGEIAAGFGAIGGLMGAFAGGTFVAADVAAAGTTTTGATGIPPQLNK